MPHGGVVVSGADLVSALPALPGTEGGEACMKVLTAAPFPAGALGRFGTRQAAASEVRLRAPVDAGTCWIESVAEGWLFLLPVGADKAWLLSVGGEAERLLRYSRHIETRIKLASAPSPAFETAPRIHLPLSGPGWLAAGTAAAGFDPICGDGTALAVREGILAAAVIAGIGRGEAAGPLLAHYEDMLLAAMRRHLKLCASFYQSGGNSEWWRSQSEALSDGFAACTAHLSRRPGPQFALHGMRLVPRAEAA